MFIHMWYTAKNKNINKLLILLLATYGIQFWVASKPSNIKIIQYFS